VGAADVRVALMRASRSSRAEALVGLSPDHLAAGLPGYHKLCGAKLTGTRFAPADPPAVPVQMFVALTPRVCCVNAPTKGAAEAYLNIATMRFCQQNGEHSSTSVVKDGRLCQLGWPRMSACVHKAGQRVVTGSPAR
jgi:hypothetical protein